MNDNIQKLLTAIKPEQVCGPDLSNDPVFDALMAIARGKPEVEIGTMVKPAEPPDWRVLRDESRKYLERSKHLNVAVLYACSLLKLEGLAGLRDGLQLIQGLLEQYWSAVYPLLDPEDANDPTQRLNILRSLTAPRGSVDGWIKYLDYAYGVDLCRPKGEAPVSFELAIAAQSKSTEGADKITFAIRSAGTEALEAARQLLVESVTAVQGIDHFLTETLGGGTTISFEALHSGLKQMLQVVESYLSGSPAAGGAEVAADQGGGAVAASGPAAAGVRGPVKSRAEVVQAIEGICQYYSQVEPGSPVPFLLRRVQKMVNMNFVEIVQELNLATRDLLRPSMGSALGSDENAEKTE